MFRSLAIHIANTMTCVSCDTDNDKSKILLINAIKNSVIIIHHSSLPAVPYTLAIKISIASDIESSSI